MTSICHKPGTPILFRPVYTSTGSCTELFMENAPSIMDMRSVDSIRSALAHEYAVDLRAQGQIIIRDFHRHPPVPFLLPEPASTDGGRVFVPLKMRKPQVARDRVYGYVDLAYIDHLEPVDHTSSLLRLTTDDTVELFCSLSAARSNIALGREVAARYLRPALLEEDQVIQAARILLGRLSHIEEYLERLVRI